MDTINLDNVKKERKSWSITMDATNVDKVKKERQVLKYYNGYDKNS
jgi:hypothetical protein